MVRYGFMPFVLFVGYKSDSRTGLRHFLRQGLMEELQMAGMAMR